MKLVTSEFQKNLLCCLTFLFSVKPPLSISTQRQFHTPTTRHTRDSLETYRSSLSTPEYQGAQRVLWEYMKPWCTQSIPNVPVDRIHTNTNLLLLLSVPKGWCFCKVMTACRVHQSLNHLWCNQLKWFTSCVCMTIGAQQNEKQMWSESRTLSWWHLLLCEACALRFDLLL